MHLYAVRHGTTDNNVDNLINGRNDIDLNQQGVKEAGRVSLVLKDIAFDKVYCSPLTRTKHTMKIINCNNIPVEYDERVIERDAGVMTNRPISELNQELWYNINAGVVYGGSESFKEVVARVRSFLEEIKKKHKNDKVLLVTHGGIFKALEVVIFGYPGVEELSNWESPNCCIREYRL